MSPNKDERGAQAKGAESSYRPARDYLKVNITCGTNFSTI